MLGEIPEDSHLDFRKTVAGLARQEIDACHPKHSLDLLEPYRNFLPLLDVAGRKALLADYLQILEQRLKPKSNDLIEELTLLADTFRSSEATEAEEILNRALQTWNAMPGARSDEASKTSLGNLHRTWGLLLSYGDRHGDAGWHFELAARAWTGIAQLEKEQVPSSYMNAVKQYVRSRDSLAAERCFQAGLNGARNYTDSGLWMAARDLGDLYLQERRPAEAIAKFEIAVAIAETWREPGEERVSLLRQLGESYERSGHIAEAKAANQRMAEEQLRLTSANLSSKTAQRNFSLGAAAWGGVLVLFFALFAIQVRRIETKKQALYEPAQTPLEQTGFFVDEPPVHRFRYFGVGSDLFGMRVYHLLLTILTLGIFSFWGKTRVRKYLCSQAEFLGDRFCFHGTGGELLRGWLRGVPLIGLLFLAPRIAPMFSDNAKSLVWIEFLASLGFLLLWPFARAGAYRYRMNRMSWRGIRFRFEGKTKEYFWTSVFGYLGMWFSVGLSSASVAMRQRRYLYSHTYVGDRRLGFSGRSEDMFWPWVWTIPLTIGTFGMFWFWYSAMRSRYYWAHTTLGEARFRCSATGWGLARLFVTNLVIFVFTLGLGSSWAAMRTVRYWSDRIELVGELNESQIEQRVSDSSAMGESFADFIGFDFGL